MSPKTCEIHEFSLVVNEKSWISPVLSDIWDSPVSPGRSRTTLGDTNNIIQDQNMPEIIYLARNTILVLFLVPNSVMKIIFKSVMPKIVVCFFLSFILREKTRESQRLPPSDPLT